MMKHIKKTLALLLALSMVFGSMGTVYADEITDSVVGEEVKAPVLEEAGDEAFEIPSEEVITDETVIAEEEISDVEDDSEEEIVSEEEETIALAAMAATEMVSITKNQSVPLDTSKFYRIFHLDAGRKYFSVAQIEAIIDLLAANNYTHLELALGNDALRFILDDMSVSANGTTYDSNQVKNGISSGNSAYARNKSTNTTTLSETDMNNIIAYANGKNVEIIPLINAPGHMDAILACIKSLGITSPAYNNSSTTVNVENAEAVNFTLAIINKYINYFAGKGIKIFNMGADEYANDVYTDAGTGHGFGHIQNTSTYSAFLTFVNNMAAQIQNAGMVTMAFNDGLYYNGKKPVALDTNIAVAYWSCGYSGYYVDPASDLEASGLKIINTNDGWYYVLGRSSGTYGLSGAKTNVQNTKVDTVPLRSGYGSMVSDPAGSMLCLWCDTPSANYSTTEYNNVKYLIETQAKSNPTYFVATTPEVPEEPEVEPVYEMTDDTIGVTINTESTQTALTAVSMVPATVQGISEAYTAYNVTINNGEYTGKATVTIPLTDVLKTAEKLVGFVINADKSITKVSGNKSQDGNSFSFEAPHFSEVGVMEDITPAADVKNTVDVVLEVGQTSQTYKEESGAYTSGTGLNTSIASAAITPVSISGKVTTNQITSTGAIGSGQKFLLVNNAAGKTLNNTSTYSGLSLDGTVAGTDGKGSEIWTITPTTGGYYVTDADGKYLSIGNGTAAVTTEPHVLAIAYSSTRRWQISEAVTTTTTTTSYPSTSVSLSRSNYTNYSNKGYYYKDGDNYYVITDISRSTSGFLTTTYTYTISYNGKTVTVSNRGSDSVSATFYTKKEETTTNTTTYYLNNYGGGGTYAAGYTTGNSDSGSRWNLYTVTATEDINSTDVQFTGVSAGTTSIVIGETLYNITVNRRNESATILAGDTTGTFTDVTASTATVISGGDLVTVNTSGNSISFTGKAEGTAVIQTRACTYTITVNRNNVNASVVIGATTDTYTDATASTATVTSGNEYVTVNTSGNSISFTGKAEGTSVIETTSCTYTIKVNKEDLSGINLPVYFWVTNETATVNGSTSMTISAEDVNSVDGVAISTLIPDAGTKGTLEVHYWKTVDHTYGNWQLNNGTSASSGKSTDQSGTGNTIKYIRYFNKAWAYSTDGSTWINITTSGSQIDHLDAYYMQRTNVTDEIYTDVKDYGVVPHTDYSSSNFVLVDFSVKYESGQETPSRFPVSGKTNAFHCDPNATDTVHRSTTSGTYWYNYYRDIGMIRGVESDDYEVYMITVTATSDSHGSTNGVASNCNAATSYTYSGKEYVAWAESDDVIAQSGLTRYNSISGKYGCIVGGDPMISGLEIFNRHGMKITYYVRAKIKEDSLNVRYVDDTTGVEFYNYGIVVNEGTTFKSNIGLNNSKAVINGDVVNSLGKTQTVSSDLSTMPAIPAAYRYSGYTVQSLERSADGKTVTIHYTFNNTHSFVIDFALPVRISTADLGISGDWTNATVSGAKYGTATAAPGQGVTYTPTETMKGVEQLSLVLTGTGQGSASHIIYIYPSTSVYYEEGFMTEVSGFPVVAKPANLQDTAVLGKDANVYGYDAQYAANGSVSKTTSTSSTSGDKASFTFTGTGFDLYADCTKESGTLLVSVKDASGAVKKSAFINTASINGTQDYTEYPNGTLRNVPIYSVMNLAHGTYTVSFMHALSASPVAIDGFRVYGTIADSNIFAGDFEDNPTFIQVRDLELGTINLPTDSSKYASEVYEQVYTQVKDAQSCTAVLASKYSDLTDYIDNGPKNEIYLHPGMSLTLNIRTTREVQIGLRGLQDSMNCTIGGKSQSVSATDMFYKISDKRSSTSLNAVTIANNNASGIIAVTKLKVCDDPSVIGTVTEDAVMDALYALGYAPDVVMTDANLKINLKDYSGKVLASTALTANGAEGETAAFAAADIQAAAEAVLPSGYAFAKEVSDANVAYGENGTVDVQIGKVATLKINYKKGSKVVGTATLTHVQTSKTSKTTFSTTEIKAGTPKGYSTISIAGTSVNFGSTKTINATCL